MKRSWQRLLIVLLTLLGATAISSAQSVPPMAGVTGDGLTVFDGGARVIAPGSPSSFLDLTWSPDGNTLLFTQFDANYSPRLYRVGRGGGGLTEVAATGFFLPATFTPDGSAILYAAVAPDAPVAESSSGPQRNVTVYRQPLDLGVQPDIVGQISVGIGCGGGSPFPMDAVYNTEAGFGGRGVVFEAADGGVIYSLNCAGVGLGWLDLASGQTRTLGSSYSRATVSPDGGRALAVDENSGQIVVISLPDGGITPVGTSRPVDQIAWAGNNAIVYSTRALMDLPLPLSEAEASVVGQTLGLAPDSIPQYSVAVLRVDIGGGETVLFEQLGWAVGRLFSQNGTVYFSLISNGEAWVEALASGAIDPMSPDSYAQAWASVPVTFLGVPVGGGEAGDVLTSVYLATPNPAG